MAKTADTWEGRRALTDNPALAPEIFQNAGRTLMDMDLPSEAALFCGLAGDEAGLKEIVRKAVKEGNFFVFQVAASRLKAGRPARAELEALIAAAEKSGKKLYAGKAAAYLEENY
ncbi:MAG: hypothetical protein LBP33_11660 [Candidatus Adiutrix sp.]|jgi:hypothetical protein|nr:hypothetical protein [Candidatus Adiutrix sp.]